MANDLISHASNGISTKKKSQKCSLGEFVGRWMSAGVRFMKPL